MYSVLLLSLFIINIFADELSIDEALTSEANDLLKDAEPLQTSETRLASEVEKTIARYIVEAPCNEVRDILRFNLSFGIR